MLLPPRPLRLKSSFVWKYQLGGVAMLLVGVVAGIGYVWWQYGTVKELVDQSRVWREGVPAVREQVKGKIKSNHGIFHEYDLDVGYVDQQGKSHQQKLKFDTLIGKVDQAAEPTVHYLESNPDHFALSWAMDVRTSRWASIAFMAIAGVGLVGGSFTYLGYLALRRLADARGCARRSDEVLVNINKVAPVVVKGKQTGTLYHFVGTVIDGREIKGKVSFPLARGPLFADSSRQIMVALVPQENLKRVTVVRDDFWPYDLTPDEQANVEKGIARRMAASAPKMP